MLRKYNLTKKKQNKKSNTLTTISRNAVHDKGIKSKKP